MRVRRGIIAYDAVMKIHRVTPSAIRPSARNLRRMPTISFGHALLLLRYTDDLSRLMPRSPRPPRIMIPSVWPIFWAFRIMAGLGFTSS